MTKITASFATLALAAALPLSDAAPASAGGSAGTAHISFPKRHIAVLDEAGNFNETASKLAHAQTYTKIQTGLRNLQANTGSLLPGATLLPALNFTDLFGGLFDSADDFFGSSKKRLVKRQKESLQDQQDSLWVGPVTIGGQQFTLDFDTGSSDTFVPASSCSSGCGSKNKYDPSKSSTSKKVGAAFKEGYGDGSGATGDQYTDTVVVGGISANDQVFGAASEETGNLASSPGDGLMGLAFSALSSMKGDPFWITAAKQGAIKEQSFSFKLASSGSELFLGGADSSQYTGALESHKVTKQAYWQIGGASLAVNGKPTSVTGFETIIDSGTTIAYGPQAAVDALYKTIPGSKSNGDGTYSIPCDSVPTVSFSWDGGKQWAIDPKVFNLGSGSSGGGCQGGIQAQDLGLGDTWLLGDVFMRNVYTKFDGAANTVSFATLA